MGKKPALSYKEEGTGFRVRVPEKDLHIEPNRTAESRGGGAHRPPDVADPACRPEADNN
jgi:hypothetical protein